VPALGPTDIVVRVIKPTFFVRPVVPSRAVRHRNSQFQLFSIVDISRDVHADGPDDHDASFAPSDLSRKFNRLIAGGCRGNQREISAPSVTEPIDGRKRIIYVEHNSFIQSQSHSLLDFVLIKIDAKYATAI